MARGALTMPTGSFDQSAASWRIDTPVLSGDRRFARFYAEHVAFVWRCARALGVSANDVDDAVQEIFLVVGRRMSSFDATGSERAWLYGITRRVCFRLRRTAFRHRRRVAAVADVGAAPVELEERAAWREATARVLVLLDALPAEKREAFVLSDVEGLTRAELADALGINPNTAWARVRSARAELARTFGDDASNLRALLDDVAIELAPDPSRRRAVLAAVVAKLPSTWLAAAFVPAMLGAAAVVVAIVATRAPTPATIERPTIERRTLDAPAPLAAVSLPAALPPVAPAPHVVAEAPRQRPRAHRPTPEVVPLPVGLTARETALVVAARTALRSNDTATTLARVADLGREFPASTLAPEASALEIAALCVTDPAAARERWRTHRSRWPTSAMPAPIRSRCGDAALRDP